MEVKALLRQLDLGNSVAEFDQALERYFVETETFRALVLNRADVIRRRKGHGKDSPLPGVPAALRPDPRAGEG
jgi:hypothetical protein